MALQIYILGSFHLKIALGNWDTRLFILHTSDLYNNISHLTFVSLEKHTALDS